MSSEEDGDESDHTDQDELSSEESGGRTSDHEVVEDDSDEGTVEEESANVNANKPDQSKRKKRHCKARIKKECPVPYCEKFVVHLPRHLLRVHGWPKVKLVLRCYGLIYVRSIPFQLQRVQLLAIGKGKQMLLRMGKRGARITTKRGFVQWWAVQQLSKGYLLICKVFMVSVQRMQSTRAC